MNKNNLKQNEENVLKKLEHILKPKKRHDVFFIVCFSLLSFSCIFGLTLTILVLCGVL